MKQDVSKYVGQQIRFHRKLKKMTQKELGLRIGKKHNTISSYENGTNEPEQDALFAIANALDVSINDLFPSTTESYVTTKESTPIVAESQYNYFPISISDNQFKKISIANLLMGKWAGNKDLFVTRVNGDSMNRIIPHCSLIVTKKVELSDLKNGDIVVFSNGGDYSIKRFFHDKENERVIFRPDSYDNRFFDYTVSYENAKSLQIHGKVVLYIVELD